MTALIPVNTVQHLSSRISIGFDIFMKALKPCLSLKDKKHDGDYCSDF